MSGSKHTQLLRGEVLRSSIHRAHAANETKSKTRWPQQHGVSQGLADSEEGKSNAHQPPTSIHGIFLGQSELLVSQFIHARLISCCRLEVRSSKVDSSSSRDRCYSIDGGGLDLRVIQTRRDRAPRVKKQGAALCSVKVQTCKPSGFRNSSSYLLRLAAIEHYLFKRASLSPAASIQY